MDSKILKKSKKIIACTETCIYTASVSTFFKTYQALNQYCSGHCRWWACCDTESCNSHYVLQLAAFFIDAWTKSSNSSIHLLFSNLFLLLFYLVSLSIHSMKNLKLLFCKPSGKIPNCSNACLAIDVDTSTVYVVSPTHFIGFSPETGKVSILLNFMNNICIMLLFY